MQTSSRVSKRRTGTEQGCWMPKVLLGSSCARMERHYENNDSADFERARDDISHELYVWDTKDIQELE